MKVDEDGRNFSSHLQELGTSIRPGWPWLLEAGHWTGGRGESHVPGQKLWHCIIYHNLRCWTCGMDGCCWNLLQNSGNSAEFLDICWVWPIAEICWQLKFAEQIAKIAWNLSIFWPISAFPWRKLPGPRLGDFHPLALFPSSAFQEIRRPSGDWMDN